MAPPTRSRCCAPLRARCCCAPRATRRCGASSRSPSTNASTSATRPASATGNSRTTPTASPRSRMGSARASARDCCRAGSIRSSRRSAPCPTFPESSITGSSTRKVFRSNATPNPWSIPTLTGSRPRCRARRGRDGRRPMDEARPADERHCEPALGRRDFLTAAGAALGAAFLPGARAQPAAFEFEEATIRALGERMARGELTAVALAEAYLARIGAIDRGGPHLRSVLELNPDTLAIAETLDRERAEGRVRGPLHGIPVLLKDNIPTGDRMPTTAGSLALDGVRCKEDAPLLRRLREAGAVILGKNNLSEWANFRSTHSLSGWSTLGGQTRNPYALDRSPSGSSSGSAVAAATSLCAAAVGTETDGSIISPSACNGLVALKPSIGFVSRTALIPISRSQDTAGPMARTVEDCALLMNAIAGPDPEDPVTLVAQVPRNPDFTAFLGSQELRGVRLGFLKQFSGVNERADRVIA